MKLFPRKERFTRQQSMAARPMQMAGAELTEDGKGGGRLKIQLRPRRWASWLFRLPQGATKTFELDALGLLVWNACDGKTSVQQMIRRLSKRYNLTLREAEMPTLSFLQTLTKKGLIFMVVPRKEKPERK